MVHQYARWLGKVKPYFPIHQIFHSKLALLPFCLQKEENDEYLKACEEEDIVEIAHEIADEFYVLVGKVISHGLQDKIMDVFDEIQRANMSKLGLDGKPIYREDGKVLKGPNYTPPDVKKLFQKE